MRAHDDALTTGWQVPVRAVAIVGLTVGLAACGARAVHQTATAVTSTSAQARVTVREQAVGASVTAEIELECTTPVASSGGHGGVEIASSTAQRWHPTVAPGHDWTTVVDVAPGATCTATAAPVAPAVLRSVGGGTAVHDGAGRLTGARTTVDAGATPELALVVGAA